MEVFGGRLSTMCPTGNADRRTDADREKRNAPGAEELNRHRVAGAGALGGGGGQHHRSPAIGQ